MYLFLSIFIPPLLNSVKNNDFVQLLIFFKTCYLIYTFARPLGGILVWITDGKQCDNAYMIRDGQNILWSGSSPAFNGNRHLHNMFTYNLF